MIDVNLGNKTLIVGVAIALILAYGMVNFNGGQADADFAFSKAEAASFRSPVRKPAPVVSPADAMAKANTEVVEGVDAVVEPVAGASAETGLDADALSAAAQRRIAEIGTPTNRYDARELEELQGL